ncbi:MAG: LysR family transcriptional regulator [Bdellovibrionota bacterium]|nr:LysR family transcriptional regulator [Bdellovibrionota bacterium]
MSWEALDFDWNRARAFLVTAEEGSFSKAAIVLQMSQTTLGRQVAGLEEELGVLLFDRVGGGLEITPSGKALIEHVKAMGEAALKLSISASGKINSIAGKVCISASESFAVYVLPPIVKKIRSLQPGIEIELVSTNETSDLSRREADIAIRNYRPTQGDLYAKKLGEENFYLYAEKGYFESLGKIKSLNDLKKANFIGLQNNEYVIKELNAHGIPVDHSNFPILSKSHLAHWHLAKQGLGIGLMASRIGDQDPSMIRVLDEYLGDLKYENWLVTHSELKTSPRIRFVFDFLQTGPFNCG